MAVSAIWIPGAESCSATKKKSAIRFYAITKIPDVDYAARRSAGSRTRAAIPASIADVTRNLMGTRQKLYQAKCRQYAGHRFSAFC